MRWLEAFRQDTVAIQGHPDFPRLVREVAVAEQPKGSNSWLARNSLTYGWWMTRGMKLPRRGPLNRRAYLLAARIAADIELWPDLPAGEREGRVYGEGLQAVLHRRAS